MFKEIDLGIHQLLELLKESYKYIDFRCASYRKDGNWNPILTVIRFSNETAEDIKKRFNDLDLKKYEIKNFKILHNVIDVSEWEEILIGIYDELNEDIDIYDFSEFIYKNTEYEEYEESFLDEFNVYYNTKTTRLFLTENEVNNYNIINCYYSIPDQNAHHTRFNTYLNEEVMLLGEDNIYDIINRALQLDGYSSQNGLYISILLPVYLKIKDINYNLDKLSGKVKFHKIFSGSKIFFRIFYKPNYENESLSGTEEFLIDINYKETKIICQDYYEIPFNISFKKYDCNPNFEIRVFWNKFPKNYLIDLQKSFGNSKYFKHFEDLKAELSEKNQDFESADLKYQKLIDPNISIDNDYRKIITDINNAYSKGFYDCVYILVRKLLENQLIDCLRNFYTMEQINKFYDQDRGKFHPFNRLKLNFSTH